MNEPQPSPPNRWRRRFWVMLALWLVSTIVCSWPPARAVAVLPLLEHDAEASGDAAYVMADGSASWERLRAASDLFHWKRVPRIIVLDERDISGYNFVRGERETRVDRVVDYLRLHGVPDDKITRVTVPADTTFGSLSEAQAVAASEPDLKSIVVVTSAPHTRRSGLCFRRSMPTGVAVRVYSASEREAWHSAEIHSPIWLEYVKYAIYLVVA